MKPILASRLKFSRLTAVQLRQRGLYVVSDRHAASDPLLQLGAHLSLGGTVRIFDCGNRADMYLIARTLRPLTADPIPAMRNIRLSRAFTCYQVETLLSRCDALEQVPVLVLDFLSTFMDESVSDDEVQRLFHDSVAHLRRLSGRNIVMVGVKPLADVISKRVDLLTELMRLSDDFVRLNEPEALIAETADQLSLL